MHGSTDLDDIYCTVEEINAIIQVEKASGPDHIILSAYMLKHTAASTAPTVTQLFNYSKKVTQIMEDINGCTNRQVDESL